MISLSQGFELPSAFLANPRFRPGNPSEVDFGRVLVDRMAKAGVATLSAAGNTGQDPSVNGLTQFTPNIHGSTISEMIVVGATDEKRPARRLLRIQGQ